MAVRRIINFHATTNSVYKNIAQSPKNELQFLWRDFYK